MSDKHKVSKSLGNVYTDREAVIYGMKTFKEGKCIDGGIVKRVRPVKKEIDAPIKGKGA